MSRHLLYIINPISGARRKKNFPEWLAAKTAHAGIRYTIAHSVADGQYGPLITRITETGVTDVIIAAGDGTINDVVAALHHLPLQFGILPCGSGNGLAFAAGISKNLDKALAVVFAGKSQATDAFRVNGAFACMLCGIGFDAQVAHDFANDPRRGLSTYIRKTVSHFFSAKAYPFSITADGVQLQKEAFFISIANSNQFGNNFTIAPQASLTDGLLDIVVVTKQNKLSLVLQTIRQVGGLNQLLQKEVSTASTGVLYFQTEKLMITNSGMAPMHIDGDPVPTERQLWIEIIRDCFRLMVP